ncbi:MAG: hypothetical protein JSS66_09310 [Armatimonadetes bacterium]|nr:hypothetical protein [Armatimonadota bacterium]
MSIVVSILNLLWAAALSPGGMRVVDGGTVSDEHFVASDRPAMFVRGPALIENCDFRSGAANRPYASTMSLDQLFKDAGLGAPTIRTSHIDASHAAVVVVGGGVAFRGCNFDGEVGIVFLPNVDGSLAIGNAVADCRFENYRFGILACGQRSFSASGIKATGAVLSSEPRGHLVYFNEGAPEGGSAVRSVNVVLRDIEETRRAGTSNVDHCSLKFKAVDDLDIDRVVTDNDFGAIDLLGCSGLVSGIRHQGGTAQGVFGAFRVTNFPGAPPARGMLRMKDCEFALTGHGAPAYRVETSNVTFSNVRVSGGAHPDIWSGTDASGVRYIED